MATIYAMELNGTATKHNTLFTRGRFMTASEWRPVDSEPAALASHRYYVGLPEPESSDASTQRRALFAELAARWHRETGICSAPDDIIQHPAYREIIEKMGVAAIPFILDDLRLRGGNWFAALREITGDGPVIPEADWGRVPRLKEAWVKWGIERGYVER
jgi:hypothetical protein